MKTVLFTGVEHRVRRRETIQHPPPGITFRTLQPVRSMKKDYQLSNVKSDVGVVRNLGVFSRVYKANNYIPKQYLEGVDLVYSPGYVLINKFPFVVEIDNVAVLAYYKLGLLRIAKPFIRRRLRSEDCKAIVCISEAAKKSVANYFKDPVIEKKCIVVYPYVQPQRTQRTAARAVRFLFVSSNFYLKGGKEVLHAFLELERNFPNVQLTIITKTHELDVETKEEIAGSKHIKLLEADLDKETLLEKHYRDADVFVQPTYQDSFGMVYLEALSAGLPIIATDMFAVQEMVEHGKNGFIIRSPIRYFHDNFLPNSAWWEKDKGKYAQRHSFPEVEKELLAYMERFVREPQLRAKMSQASQKLFRERFSITERDKQLKKALEGLDVRH